MRGAAEPAAADTHRCAIGATTDVLDPARKTNRPRPKRTSLADSVYEILLAQLIDGTRSAGESLNIDALARELEVSPTPIREALARLEATGMVRRTALKGYSVAPLFTERELADLMDARAAIEPVNARLACQRATSELVAALTDTVSELEQARDSGPKDEYHSYWGVRRALSQAHRRTLREPVPGRRLRVLGRPRPAVPALRCPPGGRPAGGGRGACGHPARVRGRQPGPGGGDDADPLVWVVLLATSQQAAAAALVGGIVVVGLHRTSAVLRLVFGARPAAVAERDAVWAAIVPVASLRGRNQPRVWVGRGWWSRLWEVLVPRRRTVLIAESLLGEIRSGGASDLEVSALVAHAAGQLPVQGSGLVLAVDLFCLPWRLVEVIVSRVAALLGRVPLMSLSWRLRPVVFGLGLMDAIGHARWEAAIPLVAFTVLTYTTGPANRAWQRTLADLGDRRVAEEGLGPVLARLVLDPKYPGDRCRAKVLLAVTR